MFDEPMQRLLDYDRRRYWLENGWTIRFRISESALTSGRPHGVKYSFTLHDVDRKRLLGYDNAHGMPKVEAYDHKHRFRRTDEPVRYNFVGADQLIMDFFEAVERACAQDGVAFEFVDEDVELEGGENDENEPSDAP